jgi:hypothetical protein
MKHFTIDAENNITFHSSRRQAKGTGGALFSTEEQFAAAIGNDNQRLLEIWNSLPGVKPVTKFANRKAAAERIWKVIQKLKGPVATNPAPRPDGDAIKSDHAPTESLPDNGAMQAAFADQSPAPPQATSEPAAGQPNLAPEPNTQQDGTTTAAESEVVASVGAQVANVALSAAKTTKKATGTKKTPTAAPQTKATREPSKSDAILKLLTGPGGASLKTLMNTTGWQAHSVRGFVSGTLGKKMGLTVISAKGETGERRYSIAS